MLRLNYSAQQMPCRQNIAAQSASAVDMGLGPKAFSGVGQKIARHQFQGKTERHSALHHQIDRIADLRVSEPNSANTSGSRAKVNTN